MFSFTNSEWVEATFQKRECGKIIPSSKDTNRCCCGLAINAHSLRSFVVLGPDGTRHSGPSPPIDPRPIPNEHWNPAKHTLPFPTDAYGCIDFRGSHTNKAQYIRLAYDTKPELVLSLLLREWCLEKPKLLITVNGGKANFEIQPKLKRSLRKGLLKAAKTTGAWILTSGTNTGVSKHVGDALVSEKSPRIKGGRVVSIGITPWGIVDKRNELLGKKTDVPFHSVSQPSGSRFATLNKHHAYFLLVDNGTVGKYGAEIALRRKLEKFISTQCLGNSKQSDFCTPLVCLVIEGGTNTIRAVLEYVTATPPVPVVVCDGTGRAADLLAFAHKYVGEDGNNDLLTDYVDHLNATIMKTFDINLEQAARLQMELRQCVRKKNLLTIFRCSNDRDQTSELDEVIMTALFKAQHLSPVEQLSLALAWNRCDIAKKEIFIYGQEWPNGALDHAMFEALDNDRVDFVRLLLDHGVNMNKFLTVSILEELYNSKNGPANTLGYLVRDVVPRMPRGYHCTLVDIGLVIGQLMGSGYVATYSRRKFRSAFQPTQPVQSPSKLCEKPSVRLVNGSNQLNVTLQKSLTSHTLRIPSFMSSLSTNGGPGGLNQGSPYDEANLAQNFDFPFSELIVWAVLTKRQEMAKLMWQHGEQAMSKALVAARLYQAMANEAADDDLDVEIYDELKSYSKYFEDLSLQLLEYCYQADDELTQHLLTASLENWSRQTCLRLAVYGNNLRFLSHPLSQVILADLWMGGLRMRKNPGFKIILGLLFPPTIAKLEFKTREELELMPQTEEELQDRDDSDSNSSASSSSTGSRRSSIHPNDVDSLSSLELGAGRVSRKRVDTEGEEGGTEGLRPSGKPSHHHRHYSVSSQEGVGLFINDIPANCYGSRMDLSYKKKTRPLKLKKKLYEFYAAPITKYFCHSIAYVVFLAVYTYLCLVRTPVEPSWPEIYVACCMINFGAEKIRSVVAKEPSSVLRKIRIWAAETRWNIFDLIGIFFFMGAFIWRCADNLFVPYAHVTYNTVICYWYIRSLRPLGVNKYFGPYVMMIGRMIENMMYFVVLLLVVLMAFGVCRQGILFPNEEPDWRLVRHIFYQPYFMLYGEVFAPDIDPECNPDCTEYGECGEAVDGSLLVPCHIGRWITPIVMTIYLLVANILLLNLLIASFNTIYNSVNSISHQIWNFERFSVVIEYEERPILPAPFTVLSHIYRIFKYCHRQCKGLTTRFETGLKLVLSKHDMERLYDFEEECVDGLLQSKEMDSMQRTEARIKTTLEVVEELRSKMEDLERWEASSQEATTNAEYRLQRMEEIAEQTLSNLAVIHRFMTTQHSGGGSIASDYEKTIRSRDSSPYFDESTSRPSQPRTNVQLQQQQELVKPRRPFSRRDTSESMQPEFCDEETISINIPMPVVQVDKVEPELDKVRFRLESDDEDDLLEVGKGALELPPVVEKKPDKKESFDFETPVPGKKNKSGNRKSRKTRHASSGGSSGDVFSTKCKLGSIKRRARRATESSRTSDEELILSRRARRKRNLSQEVQEADEIRHLDSDFDEREDNFGEMKITLTGPPRNPTASSKTDENSDKSSATTATRNLRLIAAASRHRRIQSRKRRDYTSITDELEQMIAVSPLPDRRSPCVTSSNGTRRHANNTSVEIETEHLHDAEEADYNLMEALIAKRLRRSSANLQASFEDLVTRSIREDSSPSSVSGDHPNPDLTDPTAEPDDRIAILHQMQPGSVDSGTEVPIVIVRERVRTLIMVNDAIQTDEPDQNVATGGISVVAETEC